MPISSNSPSDNILAGATTSNKQLPPGNQNGIRVYNSGTVVVFIATGGSGVVATGNSQFVAPGQTVTVERIPTDLFIAALAASATATVYFSLCSSQQQ